MKNIFYLSMFLFCGATGAAWANSDYFAQSPYLGMAASAWATVIGDFTPSGEIASYMRSAQTNNIVQYINTVSILAYNNTALNLYQVSNHIARATDTLNVPGARRTGKKTLILDVDGVAVHDDYDSGKNSDFKTRTFGVGVRAHGYVTDGFSFGVGYANGHTETRNIPVKTNGDSNSVMIFSKYTDKYGIFINSGIIGGATRWSIDKTVAGVPNDGAYDTDFWGGQMNMGVQMMRDGFFITPQIGARYARITSEQHTDAAAQATDKWWYNTLTGVGTLTFGYDFNLSGTKISPWISMGGAYDAISNGTDAIHVRVISGQSYYIPIDAPTRGAVNAEIGLTATSGMFGGGLRYKLDMRSDYTSHTAMADIKFLF